MNSQNSNPFALPGFGQAGDLSHNPLLASMEMMRQAWQGLATSGVLTQPPISAALTTEDLDRRIGDLRAVENWLRLNMSMLASSIQALEVQRATIATLKSFANVPGVPADSGDNPSPLEVALGIKPSGQAKIKTPAQVHEEADAPQASSSDPDAQRIPLQSDPAALSGAAQGWWNMLQTQFDTLAAATVAGMQAAQPAQSDAAHGDKPRKASAKRARAGSSAKPAAGAAPAAKTQAAPSARKRAVRQSRKA
ncbi:PhaM family polyhydroxyalkanoate granule multifunctional regulatory protein [Pusillimonas sp.]|uniref:PhaM family polyhydroxyalkanoate granule multifunctional regulatory protein n=1 Tax=Pusillimonas sp. TaxID=3040095 RepID=UPI0029B8063B|nr:PhaM family polyhydroxyalkanoate granule multifunctional regulatory protein [Pusillimonas sp.]MDX3894594.1 transcriptional regulator [Pusillimonas sp.]